VDDVVASPHELVGDTVDRSLDPSDVGQGIVGEKDDLHPLSASS
jgi:hypothetical protein